MMVDKAKSFNLDLEAKDNDGRSGFEIAKLEGNFEIIDIFKTKIPNLG